MSCASFAEDWVEVRLPYNRRCGLAAYVGQCGTLVSASSDDELPLCGMLLHQLRAAVGVRELQAVHRLLSTTHMLGLFLFQTRSVVSAGPMTLSACLTFQR